MVFGTRNTGGALHNEGLIRATGRYVDIFSANYYNVWTPNRQTMNNWVEWLGGNVPFMITEWYTKGNDQIALIPGIYNVSGAGWPVAGQRERGYFYQNYALALLEHPHSVGWHWFMYHDNDPEAPGDPSNIDSNKGIVDRYFNDHTELLILMRELNANAYRLIEYFDNKRLNR